MINIYQNKIAFLRLKPKKIFFISVLFVILFLIFLIFSLNTMTYDHFLTKGYVDCKDECQVVVVIPTDINIQKIKFKNKIWNPKILSKTLEIDEENMISYYVYNFSNNLKWQDKEIVNLNFYYNKQRLLKKFIKKIF